LFIFTTLPIPNPGIGEPGLTESRYDFAPDIQVLSIGSKLTQTTLTRASSSCNYSSISAFSIKSKQLVSYGKLSFGKSLRINFLYFISNLISR
jgi:hypothetical protein